MHPWKLSFPTFLTVLGIVKEEKLQPSNALSPILMTESGMTMLVRLLHSRNARLPILVTEFGIVTLVRLLQLSNALSLILVTESGIVTLVRLLHFANTLLQILVTESGIDITLSFPLYAIRIPFFSTTKSSGYSESHFVPLNAYSPISVTDSGMVTSLRFSHL